MFRSRRNFRENRVAAVPAWAASWLEYFRTRFWLLPAVMTILASVLASVTPFLDERYYKLLDGGGESPLLYGLTYGGDAEGARTLLGTVSGSAIGLAGTVFSITVAALTLASSQLGPRLLRQFIADRGNQFTLGVFVGTFVYGLLVLRHVRGGDGDAEFVPHLSVTVAVALAVLSLAVLIWFIHHLAQSIQPASVIEHVGHELKELVADLDRSPCGDDAEVDEQAILADFGPDAQGNTTVGAKKTGYVVTVNYTGIYKFCKRHNVTAYLLHRPGSYVFERTPLMLVRPPVPEAGDLAKDVQISAHRTPAQDVEFARDQLVELAVRALSPGTNDPFTAMNCIDRLGAALAQLGQVDLPSRFRHDDDGDLRVIVQQVNYDSFCRGMFAPIRQNAADSFNVELRLLEVILTVGLTTRDEGQREALWREADMVLKHAKQDAYGGDLEAVQQREQKLRKVLLSGRHDGVNVLTAYRE